MLESPTYDQEKTAYCQKFALRNLSAFRPHFLYGGVLNRGGANQETETWRDVSEHCLAAGIFADILAEELRISSKDRQIVVRAAILHDWSKKRESQAIDRELSEQGALTLERLLDFKRQDEHILRQMGFLEEEIALTGANVPQNPNGPQTDLEKIIWFVDMMLDGTEPKIISGRLNAVEKGIVNGTAFDNTRARRTRALIAAYGERVGRNSVNDLNRELVPQISREFAERMGYAGDPTNLPLYLKDKFRQRINEVSSRPNINQENLRSDEITTVIDSCRACGSKEVYDLFSLGDIRVARFGDDSQEVIEAPLTLCRCDNCTYLQLRHNIRTDLVFYPNYGYESGTNPVMVRELGSIVESTRKIVDIKSGDIWLDIASNDGELLSQVEGDGILRVGFDPSSGVAARGAERLLDKFGPEGSKVFVDYFGRVTWEREFGERKANVITAIAVFYSVQEPNKFLADAKAVLDEDGIFVVQQNYTPEMIKQLAFCNMVHEHVTYPTLTAFQDLTKKHGFEIVDTTLHDINGGSFRVYLKHAESDLTIEGGEERVKALLDRERKLGYLDRAIYEDFALSVDKTGKQVKNYLAREVGKGMKVYGLAASTRNNTRLQAWGLGPDLITGIAEKNPRKIGKKTLGIPIVPDEVALANADILYISIWFYADSIVGAYKGFLERGGKMLFPSSSNGEPYLVEMVHGEIVKMAIPTL